MKQKRSVDLPKKSLFPDWPDPPSVLKKKLEAQTNVKSKSGKRKRWGSLFCARNNWGGRSPR